MADTTVISVRGLKREARAALERDPGFVYVGRQFAGWPVSIWGNPFKPGMGWDQASRLMASVGLEIPEGEASLLVLYEMWLKAQPALVARLPELRGLRLGCWCGTWRPGLREILCHAVVLAKLANAATPTEQPS